MLVGNVNICDLSRLPKNQTFNWFDWFPQKHFLIKSVRTDPIHLIGISTDTDLVGHDVTDPH